jgi:OOP family OmpA-OmpF porin
MASTTNDNLYGLTQSFLSPDILQKISKEIDEPIERTQSSLQTIIPTLLMGIIHKGSTLEGAENIVYMASNQEASPNKIKAPTVQSGNDFLINIFGNNLTTLVSRLATITGMKNTSINRLLERISPMIMGTLNSKIRNENMSPSGLIFFLDKQKSSLISFIPSGLPGMPRFQNVKKPVGFWPKLVLAIVVAGIFIWWLNSHELANQVKNIAQIVGPPPSTQMKITTVPSIGNGLESFMTSNIPSGQMKRFSFEQLSFKAGSTTLLNGSEVELNQIATLIKNYPNSIIRIEGFYNNLNTTGVDLNLPTKRAMAIKDQLVSRGITSDRIQVIVIGASNPIALETTASGKSLKDRIDLVVWK